MMRGIGTVSGIHAALVDLGAGLSDELGRAGTAHGQIERANALVTGITGWFHDVMNATS